MIILEGYYVLFLLISFDWPSHRWLFWMTLTFSWWSSGSKCHSSHMLPISTAVTTHSFRALRSVSTPHTYIHMQHISWGGLWWDTERPTTPEPRLCAFCQALVKAVGVRNHRLNHSSLYNSLVPWNLSKQTWRQRSIFSANYFCCHPQPHSRSLSLHLSLALALSSVLSLYLIVILQSLSLSSVLLSLSLSACIIHFKG